MIFTYLHGDQTHTVRLEHTPDGGYTATIGERMLPFTARALGDGCWLLSFDGQQVRVYGAADGNNRYVYVGGEQYALTVPDATTKRRRGSGVGGDLTAQMPGQIVDVLVREGETVQSGQTLVILEAMKMEIRVTAPEDGRVRRLLVKKGDVVERGQALVEMEGSDNK